MKIKASRLRYLFFSKNFIMMLVALVAIFVSISAWFTSNQSATASGISIRSKSDGIDIAPCIKTYDANQNVVTDGPGEFGSGFEVHDFTFTKDCTGDGETLIVPDFNVTNDYDNVRVNGGKEVNLNVQGKEARSQEYARIEHLRDPSKDAPEYHYIEIEFYVRSSDETVQLSSVSALLSKTEANGGSLSTEPEAGSAKRSAYGSFNVDGLVGAMRVALLGEACNVVNQSWSQDTDTTGKITSTDAPKSDRSPMIKQILWYPRPDVKLYIPDTPNDISTWSLNTGLTSGDTFTNSYYRNIIGGGVELVSPDNDSKTKISSAAPSLGQNVDVSDYGNFERELVDLVVNQNQYQVTEKYYLTKYTVRVWIEGSDSEARRAMDGGQFNLSLTFE